MNPISQLKTNAGPAEKRRPSVLFSAGPCNRKYTTNDTSPNNSSHTEADVTPNPSPIAKPAKIQIAGEFMRLDKGMVILEKEGYTCDSSFASCSIHWLGIRQPYKRLSYQARGFHLFSRIVLLASAPGPEIIGW